MLNMQKLKTDLKLAKITFIKNLAISNFAKSDYAIIFTVKVIWILLSSNISIKISSNSKMYGKGKEIFKTSETGKLIFFLNINFIS